MRPLSVIAAVLLCATSSYANPIADAPATSESSAAPPPIATICQTSATIQMPVPIIDDTSAAASQR